jgi:surfactin synthase thioesterase subunit
MRKIALAITVLMVSFLAGCSGGGDSAESVAKEITANITEMGVILTGITDEASAKAAVPRIEALRAKMRDAGKRAKGVPKINAATEKKIGETNQKAMAQAMQSIGAAQQRLMARPELIKIIEPAMRNMENDL